MAFALVGLVGAVKVTAANTANTPAWGTGSSRTAGNLLTCVVAGYNAGAAITAPATPSGWTAGPFKQVEIGSGSGPGVATMVFYKIAAGGDAAPTIPAKTNTIWNAQLKEFSGNAATSPLDQSGSNSATSGSSFVVTNGGVDAAPGELVLTVDGAYYSAAAVKTLSDTLNNGAVATSTTNNATSIIRHYCFGYGFTTGNSGADTNTFAYTTTNIDCAAAVLASFLLASGGTTVNFTLSTTGKSAPSFTLSQKDPITLSTTGKSTPSFGVTDRVPITLSTTGKSAPAFTLQALTIVSISLAATGKSAPMFMLSQTVHIVFSSTGKSSPAIVLLVPASGRVPDTHLSVAINRLRIY